MFNSKKSLLEKGKTQILYLSYDGLTDPLGQSQILPYVIELSKKGYSYTIISFEKKRNYRENAAIIKELTDANSIFWIPLVYHYTPKVLSTVYDCILFWLKAKSIVKKQGIKLVHCRSYIPALIGLGLKNKYGIKFIFDMRGFWIEERVEGGLWNPQKYLYRQVIRFFRKKEIKYLDKADAIICLTQKASKILEERDPDYSSKISIIPCCVDTDKFDFHSYSKESIGQVKAELGIKENEFVLTYLGSIGTWYLLKDMLCFFKECLKKNIDSRFLFITNDEKAIIQKEAEALDISPDKLIFKRVPNKLVPKYLMVSDYSIFFIKSSFSKQASSPTKQGEIMAMGIPVICNAGIGDTDQIVLNYHSGLLINELTTESYVQAASSILNRNSTWSKDNIREGAIDYFSLSKGAAKYLDVYKEILK